MATLRLKEPTTLEEIGILLESRLPGRFGVEIKNNYLRLVENNAKGCVASLRSRNGENTCSVMGFMPSIALRAGLLVGTIVTLSLITSLVFGELNVLLGGAIPLVIVYVSMRLPSRDLVADIAAVIENELADTSRPRPQIPRWWPISVAGIVVLMLALAVLRWPVSEPTAVSIPGNTAIESPIGIERVSPQPSDKVLPSEYSVIAQVSGRIEHLHPNLKPGKIIPKETVLVRIDAEDLEISLQRTEAELDILLSEIETLDTEESVVQKVVELRRQTLKEERNERLQSQMRREIKGLQHQLESIVNRRRLSESGVTAIEQELAQLRARLERTAIYLPVDIHIDAVLVEPDGFVSAGSILFRATATDAEAKNTS